MAGRIINIQTGWLNIALAGTGAAAFDLLEAKLAATQFGFVRSCRVLQHSLESVSKIEELRCSLKRGLSGYTSGSNGQAATVVKGNTGDAAHGLSFLQAGNKTQASGSLDILDPAVFPLSAGEYERTRIPELVYSLAPSEGVILSIDEVVEETLTMQAEIILELFG